MQIDVSEYSIPKVAKSSKIPCSLGTTKTNDVQTVRLTLIAIHMNQTATDADSRMKRISDDEAIYGEFLHQRIQLLLKYIA